MTTYHYVVAYDIKDDKSRHRALSLLRKQAESYQESVFEITTNTAGIRNLQSQLLPLISEDDALMVVRLKVEQSWQLGTGLVPVSGEFVVLS